MTTLAPRPVTVQGILMWRPYLAWERVPLAAALCTLGYDDLARAAILDRLRDGATLADLVPHLVEPADLAGLEAALAEGRSAGWMGRYRERGGFLPAICGGDGSDAIDWSAVVPPELEGLDPPAGGLGEGPRWDDARTCPCGRTSGAGPCRCDPRDDEPAYTDAEWDEMCRASGFDPDVRYGYE